MSNFAASSLAEWSTAERFWRLGRVVLAIGLLLGLACTLTLAWQHPLLMPIVPAVALTGCALAFLGRHPLAHLAVVVVGFASLLTTEEGIQWYEAAFGFYYLGYVSIWAGNRLLFERQRIVRSPADRLLVLFLVYATASSGLSVVFRADPAMAFSQWIALSVLLLYFPVKEACRQDARAQRTLLIAFALLALIVIGKNVYEYFLRLTLVEHLYQIVQNRAREGERLLMLGLLGSAAFSFHTAKRGLVLVMLAFAGACAGGVIIGQSRTIWLATMVGIGVLFVLFTRRQRIRFLGFLLASVLLFGAIGFILLSDIASLVFSGLGERFASIGTATTRDISLVNRFYEWRTVSREILMSPVVGHGFAVPYPYFDIIVQTTVEKMFVHNTYLALLHRHGVIGLGLVLGFFAMIARDAAALLRQELSSMDRPAVLACVASLVTLALAAITEGMFLSHDGLLCLIFPAAVISGLRQRETIRTIDTRV